MKLGTETGSLMNHLMSDAKTLDPQVGMGATILGWTDRFPATIIKVTRCTVTVQADHAQRIDTNGMSECQQYTYSPNPEGAVTVFRKTKSGSYRGGGYGLLIGDRKKYHDYSF